MFKNKIKDVTDDQAENQESEYDQVAGCCFNEKYCILFTKKDVWYVDLKNIWKGLLKVDFQIAETALEMNFFIKKIYSGSFPMTIAIVCNHSAEEDEIIVWDLQTDQESEAFKTSTDSVLFWDSYGYLYISEADKVTIVSQGVNLKCFQVGDINQIDSKNKLFK